MLKSMTQGLNLRKVTTGVFVMFLYVWVSDFLIHGIILGPMYAATQSLWRSQMEMRSHMGWMLLGQFLIAKFLMIIYAKGYQNKGRWEGFRFGLLVGPLMVAPNFMMYAVAPWPLNLVGSWIGLGLLQAIGAGFVAQAVYSKK